MYFKQLEIVGFKSFPNKTKIKFEPGVTAVVGPNGCGKSNISDAIRWVLGEQSPKSLRGSAMEDIIFSGTDSVDATNMAEVSLTLSNESRMLPIDYDEVTITRRLFRSGESEYILNKTPVRLKDISHLLMGTGMGTSSYSIIEQGKIDRILSSKPEERRDVFEEASGITKYKSQKREAMRKLEHTENNLVRINDIITEVRRQINSIERHAKKAEKYKVDFEVMKDMDLKLAVYELKNIKESLGKNEEDLGDITGNEQALKAELDEATSLINRYREELDHAINNITEAQNKLSETTIFIDRSKHKVLLNNERISDLSTLKTTTEEELVKIKEKISLQEEEISSIKTRFQEIIDTKEENEKTLLEKKGLTDKLSHEIDTHQKEIKTAKNTSLDLLALQTKTKNELIKLGADLQNRKSRLRRLETERENVEVEKKSIEESLRQRTEELNGSEENVRECSSKLEEFNSRLSSLKSEFEAIERKVVEGEKSINSLKSKEDMLKEMIENFEGFDKGVKLIMEGVKSGVLTGIKGTIADMIEPESGYEQALEAALGKKAQAVVVETREALKKALAYIDGKGVSHFIVEEDMLRNNSYLELPTVSASSLLSFVKADASHRKIAEHLLGDICVTEDIENAHNAINASDSRLKFVTKKGFFTERGYAFGGFSNEDSMTSVIGRNKRLKDMAEEIKVLSLDIELMKEGQVGKKTEIGDLKMLIAEETDKLKKREIELANARSRKEAIDLSMKKIEDEFSVISLEISEVGELIHDISIKGDSLNNLLNEKEGECERTHNFINSSQDAIQDKTNTKNNILLEMSEVKSEISFLRNTEESEARNLDKEINIFNELEKQSSLKEHTKEDAIQKIELLQSEAEELEKEIVIKTEEEKSLKETLESISQNRIEISKELQEKEKVYREKEAIIDELRNKMHNFEIQQREKELMEVNIKDRMRQAYKLNIEEVDINIDEVVDWEDIRNQIEVLKIKLEKLGPVNLVAIEEHKDLEERYTFLTQQQEDLVSAKESLLKAIQKINKTTKILFIETFQKIQVEFKDYFRMLFGGGHAELLLLDETDVLESGIEIVARPPGKKLQNLLLMSGGEKALTAIALLFAIFKVKPSPFCILDEVDAPLDESNIGKFTRILSDFFKTSQFIVITHSKRTMQMANVLYGITMQEKGVSKIVSVKFSEEEKKASEKKEVMV